MFWYVRITYGNDVTITFRFSSSLERIFYYVTITLLVWCSYIFLVTLEFSYIWVRSNYVWKWRDNYVSFLLLIVTYFLLRRNYVICLFDVVRFLNDVRNRFYFGMFELHMEITLQLGFVRHCNVFLLPHNYVFLLVRCSYVSWWR